MRKSMLLPLALMLVLPLCACSVPVAGSDSAVGEAIEEDGMTLTKIGVHSWVFTSYYAIQGSPVPANGMLIATREGFVMVNTPWTDEQTEALLKWIDNHFGKKVVLALFTHAHIDCIGGIKEMQNEGIRSISTKLTAEAAEKNGFAEPEIGIEKEIQSFNVGGVRFETYYPGKAHTADNITVWIPEDKVLYGGCMIKSADAANLGDTADADLGSWPSALDAVKKRYPDAEIIVPGHGAWGNMDLLDHTAKLCE